MVLVFVTIASDIPWAPRASWFSVILVAPELSISLGPWSPGAPPDWIPVGELALGVGSGWVMWVGALAALEALVAKVCDSAAIS